MTDPSGMFYRKLRACAALLVAAMAFTPLDSASQSAAGKAKAAPQASGAQGGKGARTTARKPAKKTAKKAVKRAAPPPPPIVPTAPHGVAALRADMTTFVNRVSGGDFGVMAVSLTRGDTLFAHKAGVPLIPASLMKMLTAAAVFEEFGPDHQFSTDILHDGSIGTDGVLTGNLYLRGDGDPSLSGRYLTGGPAAPMNYLADQLAERGVRRITGRVIGDATAFDDRTIPDGWLSRYLQSGYAARVSGLSLNENLVWVTIAGGSVKLEPATNAFRLVNNVRFVPGDGARLSIRRQPDGTITVSGTAGRSSPPRRYQYVVENPAPFTTGALHEALIARGIAVDGGVALGGTPDDAVRIAGIQSPTLDRMVAAMNRESINHFGELLFRNAARGRDRAKEGNVANGQSLLRTFFATKVGTDTTNIQIADGSGLSPLHRITPRAITRMLGYAHDAEWGPWFHASLPVAGESELMRRRMRGGRAQGNLHAKTGTTNDVVALSGYVTAVNGELIAFTFIYNGRDRGTARAMIDVMGQTLANFAR